MAATGNAVGCVARKEGTRRDKQAAGTSSSPPPGGRLVATTASGSRMGGGTSARWRRLRRGAWRPTAGERSWAQQAKMGGRLIPAAATHARGEREARAEGDVLGGGGGEAGIPTRDIPVDLVGAKLLPHQPRTPVARRPSPVDSTKFISAWHGPPQNASAASESPMAHRTPSAPSGQACTAPGTRYDGPGNDVFSVSFLTMEGCCCLVCDGDGDMHLDGAHDGQSPVGRRRTAPETASVRKPTTWVELGASPVASEQPKRTCRAEDAVAGLMALSNGQIQGAGVDKDSNSGDVVCRVKRTEYSPPIEGEYVDTGDP
uniref:Uncharacterized protein n=1 Tax=Oryza rufipogon TaxID=4529 RepID=A0A0E0PMD0_ORYRU